MKRTHTCPCGKPTTQPICSHCAHQAAWALINIGFLYIDLETIATKQTNTQPNNDSHTPIGKTNPLPIDMRFINTDNTHGRPTTAPGTQLKYDTWATIVAWTKQTLTTRPPINGPTCHQCIHTSCAHTRRRRPPGPTIPNMIRYLARQHTWITQQTWAPQYLDEITNLETRLKKFADTQPPKVLIGACHGCNKVIYAQEDQTQVTCTTPGCGRTYDVQASRDGLEQHLDQDLMTAAEISTHAMRLSLNTTRHNVRKQINQWHTRSVITPAGHTKTGEPLFRYGDVRGHLTRRFQPPADTPNTWPA